MFEKIEDYYIVKILNLDETNYKNSSVQNFNYKYTCVKKKNNYYYDLLTNKKYLYGIDLHDENIEHIDTDYSLIPLSDFISLSDSEIVKEQLIRIVSIILTELNNDVNYNENKIQRQR